MTIKDSYSLLHMDECVETLGKAKILTALDAYGAYWQVDVKKDDRSKTTFGSHSGA